MDSTALILCDNLVKIYKVADDYIVLTENSLYIVSGKIQKRRIQASVLRGF
jgi:hypothetical protein